jgi:methyl-accepting chemotaxis protein
MNILEIFNQKIHKRADAIIEVLLFSYFLLGIGLSFYYDTWAIGVGVGVLNLLGYFLTKYTFRGKIYHHYYASAALGIFMAQFIYQKHGLFEMHFTAFIGAVAVIAYQNWRTLIPLTLVIVVHHSAFAYVQYLGFTQNDPSLKEIYFTQLNYMSFEVFLFHATLFAVAALLAGLYSYDLERTTKLRAADFERMDLAQKVAVRNSLFANEIAKGNYSEDLVIDTHDELGNALANMRKNLFESSKREAEDRFLNVGLAEVADISRKYNQNTQELSYQVLRYLIKYLEANQGGLFLLDERGDTPVLNLAACYAYERKKFLEKDIPVGEGLVGQCFLEKEIIYLRDVPQNYIRITSGLGDAPPRFLLMIPLKNEDVVEGVMELASFRDFLPHHVKLVEKVCNDLASTIKNLKVNEQTKSLYQESQQQAEELKSQEEEMRQNMEEIAATQEELRRKNVESENRIRAINESGIGSIEFDLKGNIIHANDVFLKLMGYTLDEITGQHHRIFVPADIADSPQYEKFWEDLGNGISQSGDYRREAKNGKTVYLFGAYSVLKDPDGRPMRVLKMAMDITRYKMRVLSEMEA